MIGLLDVGGTKLLAATASGSGGRGPARRRPTPRSGDVVAALTGLLDEAGAGAGLEAIAVAVPGPFDRAAGRLLEPPGMSDAWHGLGLAEALTAAYGCPVVLENDANCAALAEAHHGAGRGATLLVYYTVSTGIGTGVVRGGRLVVNREDTEGGHQVLWPGRAGGPACDCGGTGCLEAIASGRALQDRYGRPPEELEDQEVWDDVGEWLGLAAVNTTALLDCDSLVFGGGVASARWPRIEPALTATVARHLHLQAAPSIRVAALGEDRNLAGALLVLHGSRGG